jgi:bisphosphoglycerate-dependent phosphoglycerate mutase
MNNKSDHVGEDIKARTLITTSEPKLESFSKTVERLEPVIADTVIKMLSTNEKLF